MNARETALLPELEKRIRARGVRVGERLALLRELATPGGSAEVVRRRDELLEAVRRAAADVRVEASAR